MILFASDNHYDNRPGAAVYDCIRDDYEIAFFEDDWGCFSEENLEGCHLLILNMIGDTCGLPHPDSVAEKVIKQYMESGRPVLLLHGSSAAFWKWKWWREIVGFRWVRPEDPDGVAASWHPVRPYKVVKSKSRHALISNLRDLDLPSDEIYISLEQVSPAITLMETYTDEGVFPQCYETVTPWGGRMLAFIPGHAEVVTTHPDVIHNIKVLIDDLL